MFAFRRHYSALPASRVRAFASGVAAGASAIVVELAARLIFLVPTLPELLQDRLIRVLPGPVFSLLLNRLHYLGKPLLFGSLLVGQLVIAGLLGLAIRRTRRPAEVLGLTWLATGALLLPIAGRPPFAASAAFAIVLAVALASYALTLESLWNARTVSEGPGRRFARREAIAVLALLGVGATLAWRVIGKLPSFPVADRGALPPPITPAQDFYIVSKNLVDPNVPLAGWRLAVDGLVQSPMSLTYADLTALPSEEFVRTLECISNEVGGDLISTGRFTGVRLGDVLQRAGIRDGAAVVHFTSADGYTENLSVQKAMDPNTFLVYLLDGEPLPAKHGYPVRVLAAGLYGMKNPKWLQHIEVTAQAPDGFWEQQGWTPDAVVQTMSRIDASGGATPTPGAVPLAGIAFAGDRGVRVVEVSTDDGHTWQAAELDPPLGPLTWVFWQQIARLDPGSYTVRVRATDGAGHVQDATNTDTFPRGATGYHHIQVRVTG